MENVERKLPLECPSCQSRLRVQKMHCAACGTEVSGDYQLPLLARLSDNEQKFIIEFVKSSGSLKDMAKSMGVSYPTVRNYLDDIIEKLNEYGQ